MTHRRLALIAAVGTSLSAHALGAQCVPGLQQLLAARQFDRAHGALDAQLKKAPNDDAAIHCAGRMALDQDSSTVAMERFEKAVALNPKSALHHLWLSNALRAEASKANVLSAPGLASRMRAELDQSLAIDPNLVEARSGLLQFYAGAPAMMGGSIDLAKEQAAALLKLNAMRGHMGLATIAEQENNFADAEKEFLAAITAKPDSDVAYFQAGAFYRRREKWSDAIAMYEKQLTVIAKDAPVARLANAHYGLGLAHQKSGHNDKAKSEFQAALAANPDNTNAKKALASMQ